MDSTDGFNYDEAKYQNKNNKMMAWTMNVFFFYDDATHQRYNEVVLACQTKAVITGHG